MKVQQNRWAINPMAYTVYTYHKTLQWLMNAIPAMQWLILASSSGEKPAPECRNTLQWLAKRCYHAPIAAHDEVHKPLHHQPLQMRNSRINHCIFGKPFCVSQCCFGVYLLLYAMALFMGFTRITFPQA